VIVDLEKNKRFLVVNAFAEKPFGGNPAAVFPNAQGLPQEMMQSIARQMNLVETVFVTSETDVDFRLRYFTPKAELPVAGHPTIAAWCALLHEGIVNTEDRNIYTQGNQAGVQEIKVERSKRGKPVVTMKQPSARFLDTSCTAEQAAAVFSISKDAIDDRLPIQAVDTGLGHLIIPVRTLDVLMSVKRRIETLKELCQKNGVREAQLFCFETFDKTCQLHTRNLCPREGLEDPACGVGNGALTAYLSRFYRYADNDFTLRIEQGNIVDMPSVIHTRAMRSKEDVKVFVGGSGIVMMEGQLIL
jgi:trans-2,3-dihydro-3-hydroxyanthranilate isomerase